MLRACADYHNLKKSNLTLKNIRACADYLNLKKKNPNLTLRDSKSSLFKSDAFHTRCIPSQHFESQKAIWIGQHLYVIFSLSLLFSFIFFLFSSSRHLRVFASRARGKKTVQIALKAVEACVPWVRLLRRLLKGFSLL